ncbi:MAG: translocated intimin receptor Tir [Acidobacteria bacterium]|nr:MAG: translocated intimin receptor Tir [Acidobacteriota bacterium]PYY14136.1 MAG: translocated intimin receptor Tir [Acidobacteriota bacterium]
MSFLEVARAVVTDVHFLIPVAVLIIGVGLLIKLH